MAGQLQRQLGASLRAERERRRWSQEQLADFLGVHRTYVGALERGERNPSLRVVEGLAEHLGVDALTLLGGAGGQPVLRAAGRGDEPPDARGLRKRPRP
jgi:transcriptional regulator with XRE-family HTH domain